MTAPKPKDPQAEPTPQLSEPAAAGSEAPQTVTLSLEQLAELVSTKVAEAIAAIPAAKLKGVPAVPFQNLAFDKGSHLPRVVMTLGDPNKGNVETRTVQERHAHILEALGWTRQD